MRQRRVLRGATSLLLVISGGVALGQEPVAASLKPARTVKSQIAAPKEEPVAQAVSAARTSGRKVEITSQRTETKEVFANPDGSFSALIHLRPVRVRRANAWVPVDGSLRRDADGRVRPVATSVPVEFSGGGVGPLVRLGSGPRHISLTWAGRLPVPVLGGSTATYRDVLPGVDLKLTATASGFSKVFVLRSRASAARLASIQFRVATGAGLVVRTDLHRNTSVVDRDGAPVFHTGAPLMWDSSPVARRAVGKTRYVGGTLSVYPDRGLLTSPQTRFPIYMDPDFSAGRAGFALVLSGHSSQAYWGGDGENLAKVGYCGWSGCNGIGVARSYFQFDTSAMVGKHVTGAEFNVFENYAPSCSPRPVQAWGTDPVASGTTWNNQPWWPGVGIHLGTANVAYGRSGCAADWVGFNATGIVSWSAARGYGTSTIMLKAENESDAYAWKKFATDPSLTVHYNTYPSAPSDQTVAGKACATEPNEPYSSDTTPDLSAVLSDPDGGLVHADFEYWDRSGARRGEVITRLQSSGTRFTVTVPEGVYGDGAKVAWRVRTGDGTDYGPWGPWCDLTIDKIAPHAAPEVKSTLYPECELGGGIGRTGEVTLAANGVADVTGFRYGLDNASTPTYVPATNGTATIKVTPPRDGPSNLYVRSVDRAGNPGPIYVSPCGLGETGKGGYHFVVGQGTPPVGHWPLDGLNDTVVRDESTRNHDGPLDLSGATWKLGRFKDGLLFNGSTGGVGLANGPVVRTDATFTVAGWVKLDRTDGGNYTLVSQDGNRISGFFLQYRGNVNRWVFWRPDSDCDTCDVGAAYSISIPRTGVWTHLAGVYDAGTGQVRLYVNGLLEATANAAARWDATGAFQLGRAKFQGRHVDHLAGTLDEVRAYDRALSANEVAALATVPATEELFLPLDEGAGASAGDAAGWYRNGVLSATGATWLSGGKIGSSALRLSGTGSVRVPGPVVRTDSSFTVHALVRLDEADPDTAPGAPKAAFQTVVSQDGPQSSGFALQYLPTTQKWAFVLSEQDAANPRWLTVQSATDARAGEWVHLAGVYDAAARQIRLYVQGTLVGSEPANVLANVAGDLVVGRGRQAGAGGDTAYLSGMVDDVHVWTGVRTPDQLKGEFLNPVTARPTPYTGQLTRYWSHEGYHIVTTGQVPPGAHVEGPLGLTAPEGAADTRVIYSCRNNAADYFLSGDPLCEGRSVLGAIGSLYRSAPPGIPTAPIYRCVRTGGGHFASHDVNCEGSIKESLLGYARAYGNLIRSVSHAQDDRAATSYQLSGDYRTETGLGMVALWGEAGTTDLKICRDGSDTFLSTQADCEGKARVRSTGGIWTAPPAGVASAELLRCRYPSGQRFESLDPACDGAVVDRSLGFVITAF